MELYLRPSEIRFMHNSINPYFCEGDHVNHVMNKIVTGSLDPEEDFTTMKVVKRNGKYYSRNNRMLYVFRVAEFRGALNEVRVRLVRRNQHDARTFTTWNDGREVVLRKDAKTLPHCAEDWLASEDEIVLFTRNCN